MPIGFFAKMINSARGLSAPTTRVPPSRIGRCLAGAFFAFLALGRSRLSAEPLLQWAAVQPPRAETAALAASTPAVRLLPGRDLSLKLEVRAAVRRGTAALARVQAPDGSWNHRARTTALAVMALARNVQTRAAARRGARWLLDHAEPSGAIGGNAVTTAWALLALESLPGPPTARLEARRRARRYLRACMGAQGFAMTPGGPAGCLPTCCAVLALTRPLGPGVSAHRFPRQAGESFRRQLANSAIMACRTSGRRGKPAERELVPACTLLIRHALGLRENSSNPLARRWNAAWKRAVSNLSWDSRRRGEFRVVPAFVVGGMAWLARAILEQQGTRSALEWHRVERLFRNVLALQRGDGNWGNAAETASALLILEAGAD